jgi:hypothetical protein
MYYNNRVGKENSTDLLVIPHKRTQETRFTIDYFCVLFLVDGVKLLPRRIIR